MATKPTKRRIALEMDALILLRDLIEAVSRPAEGAAAYDGAVEYVATILRPRFESGELHGWDDESREKMDVPPSDRRPRGYVPPIWRVEDACGRLFLRTPEAALLAVRYGMKSKLRGEHWAWASHNEGGNTCLLGVAVEYMALDVIAFARAAGWYKPTPGEERIPKARRRAVRGSMTACPSSRRAVGQAARRGAA